MENGFFERELESFPFDVDEKDALRRIIRGLDAPLTGTFDSLYDESLRNISDVLGLLSKYETMLADSERERKLIRANLDKKMSGEKNVATGKPYTRDAIDALIESDDEVGKNETYIRSGVAFVKYLRSLDRLVTLRHERLLNANIDARRANWQQQG